MRAKLSISRHWFKRWPGAKQRQTIDWTNDDLIRVTLTHTSPCLHYSDVIMGAMASQITNLTIVYSIAFLCADQRKLQSSAPLAFVRGIHRWQVKSPHKGPVTRKMLPFDDVITESVHIWNAAVFCGISSARFKMSEQQKRIRNLFYIKANKEILCLTLQSTLNVAADGLVPLNKPKFKQ